MKTIRFNGSLRSIFAMRSLTAYVQKQERRLMGNLASHLDHFEHSSANETYELIKEWNHLHKILRSSIGITADPGALMIVVEAWFLRDLIRYLTPRMDEEVVYVTGPEHDGMRTLSRMCTFALDRQSPVYARGNAKACSDALIEMSQNGNTLGGIAHSHPGSGAGATHPSPIDTNHLGKLQQTGSRAIGIIVTRDGHVRFFTVNKPFRVTVLGEGVKYVEENVYQILPVNKD